MAKTESAIDHRKDINIFRNIPSKIIYYLFADLVKIRRSSVVLSMGLFEPVHFMRHLKCKVPFKEEKK